MRNKEKPIKVFGHKIPSANKFGHGFKDAGEILTVGGKGLAIVGGVTGQPEITAVGGGAIGAGQASKKVGSVILKASKKKDKK